MMFYVIASKLNVFVNISIFSHPNTLDGCFFHLFFHILFLQMLNLHYFVEIYDMFLIIVYIAIVISQFLT